LRISLDGVSKHHGATTVLDNVTLSVTPDRRLGVVGPNGVGKSTLLRLIAGIEAPDSGSIRRTPATLTAGYLPQEHDRATGETLLDYLARRTGVAAAQQELEAAASALAAGGDAVERGGAEERYAAALDRVLALGGGDLEARAGQAAAELGLPVALDRPLASLSGGEAARVALAAILLSRFDVLLLDEPTNDLDFDGLERLERFVATREGGLVVVSHDREFLDRTVTRIVELDPWTRRAREWAGGFSEYEAARDAARETAYERFEHAEERRRHIEALLAQRRTEARAGGAMADRRGTNALRSKVRLAERAVGRAERPNKPYEPWELQLRLQSGERANDRVATLEGATARRGAFELGPVNLLLGRGERVLVTGRNGSGKSTLLGMLLGDVPLAAGARSIGRNTVIGTLEQGRGAYEGDEALLERFRSRAGMRPEEARTLLAKFGLGADHVGRACSSLSPGERTRAHLAELQARRVNLLVLDEPTNHLDLEAVEQLESALQGYDGTVVLVTHDRRFIDRYGATRTLAL